ncbi:hypothetical protein D9M69_683440 [compost metagenome]
MAAGGKQAGVKLAFGRQAGATAVGAEGLRDTGDDAEFAATIAAGVAPASCSFASVIRGNGLQRHFGIDTAYHFGRRNDFIHFPAVRCTYVHVFDEAQDVGGVFEIPRHRQNFLIVHATFDDHIDLDRTEADAMRGFYAFQHI